MEFAEIKGKLLAHVLHPNYRPVKPRVIARQLSLDEDDIPELKRALRQLIKEGQVTYGTKHLVLPAVAPAKPGKPGKPAATEKEPSPSRAKLPPGKTPAPHGNQITGVFRRVAAGHGFVRPAGVLPGHEKTDDIYIPSKRSLDAASGDTVLVRLRGASRDRPNPEGEVIEVIERETNQFVGTYFEQDGGGYVLVDGGMFSAPISVGDPGAKNARADDKVVLEMVRFPSHVHDGEGVITEVLGQRGAPGVDTLSIIREYSLPEDFAADALEEARRQARLFEEAAPDEKVPEGRLDLTAETIITIDPVDARDFDDAISLVLEENGHWRLGVHIADVSHFVEPGSPLDREAWQRGTSVYLPDRVIPMIPELISNGLASLQPDRVRFTKTAFIEFTETGAVVGADFHSAAIKSCRRFAYEEVDQFLADPQGWEAKLAPAVHALLGRMRDLARILRARRKKAGALELSMPEVKVDLDKNGEVVGAHTVENTESHQIIEEFMLSANEAVARHLEAEGLNFLRRVHYSPDPRKAQSLEHFVADLGLKTNSLLDRFELQRLLERVRDLPECRAVNYAVLRSLPRAVYSPDEEGHYALASTCYCHFTSPIRRYPDLTIHRLLNALLTNTAPVQDFNALVIMGQHCSDRERRAEEAERELTKSKLLTFFSTRIGHRMQAVVTGVEDFGLFAQGLEIPAEGLIHIQSLSDDYYLFERRTHTLTGRRAGNTFRLGDMLQVSVARVDLDRRSMDFRLEGRGARAARPQSSEDRKGRKDTKGKGKGKGKDKKGRKGKNRPGRRERKERKG